MLSGEPTGIPETHDVPVEALRLLNVITRSATKSRTQAINQMHNIVATPPDELRT